MTPLVSRKKEPESPARYIYHGEEFFQLIAAAAWPYGAEQGAIVIIGETFERAPDTSRLALAMLLENPSVPLEDFSNDRMEEFKQCYCLEKIWGNPRNDSNISEIPKIHRAKTLKESIDFIESLLARKILRLDDQRSALLKTLSGLKSAHGSPDQYPLVAAWFYALAVADVHQTATCEEPGLGRFVQRYANNEYDEFL